MHKNEAIRSLIFSRNLFFLQQKEQEKVEIRDEVAKEMSDLVVYCQPRSKNKDLFGTAFHFHTHFIEIGLCDSKLNITRKLPN